jgi:ADP-ribosylglycohydrolase
MSSLDSRRAGLLYGSFVAEALSLGVHWIYDPAIIVARHGRVTDFYAPGSESYHPHKQAGDQGHVGDQALRLLTFLQRERAWSAEAFLNNWCAMWPSYTDYVDKATKGTLANLASGATTANSGAPSDELAGPARIAPLVAMFADRSESELVAVSIEQTVLTHRSPDAVEAAEFLARASHRLLHGAALAETIRALAPAWALNAAEKALPLSATEAIGQLGRACSLSQALPALIYLTLKHGDDIETAFIENAMAGGDNCARALALGLLLGAAQGVEAIPARWRDGLRAASQLDVFLSIPNS